MEFYLLSEGARLHLETLLICPEIVGKSKGLGWVVWEQSLILYLITRVHLMIKNSSTNYKYVERYNNFFYF